MRRGHPVAGAIAGFLFFFFVGLWLMLFGIIPLEGPWMALSLLGLVLGAIWGAWAPIGRKRPRPTTFVPTIPLGEPVGRSWTVRPVTGEQPVTPPVTGEQAVTPPVTGEQPAVPPLAGPTGTVPPVGPVTPTGLATTGPAPATPPPVGPPPSAPSPSAPSPWAPEPPEAQDPPGPPA